ncbi:hypothetical protein [Gluconacetobacter entanii]|uniref:Uncharacterized protein n=1 Tax=Gluconacetobacter entanii TaxID=108528 RepID=A0A318PWY1_9PROT|nr:hypothetical protein [Gluconacetobacter entanii]PYD63032.1 hypothetical protein CFR72_09515 [Gluconacetobacter entanii]
MRSALLAGLLALSACASQPRVQTTIPAAMLGIQASLAQAGAVSVSHAADWTPERAARHEEAARLIADLAALRDRVAEPIMNWNGRHCAPRRPAVPFVGGFILL